MGIDKTDAPVGYEAAETKQGEQECSECGFFVMYPDCPDSLRCEDYQRDDGMDVIFKLIKPLTNNTGE